MLFFLSLLLSAVLAAAAPAQTPAPSGASTFGLYCASCHGRSAKGDGPMASVLTRRPADLTEIAKRNGGTFPSERIAQIIDGRSPVRGHGGMDMPIWGDAFAKSSDPTPAADRIARIVLYLESIQTKP